MCLRCDGCKFKIQKKRVVCSRCRDRRCPCKVCGQTRPKNNRIGDTTYVPICDCSCTTTRKRTLDLAQLLLSLSNDS